MYLNYIGWELWKGNQCLLQGCVGVDCGTASGPGPRLSLACNPSLTHPSRSWMPFPTHLRPHPPSWVYSVHVGPGSPCSPCQTEGFGNHGNGCGTDGHGDGPSGISLAPTLSFLPSGTAAPPSLRPSTTHQNPKSALHADFNSSLKLFKWPLNCSDCLPLDYLNLFELLNRAMDEIWSLSYVAHGFESTLV